MCKGVVRSLLAETEGFGSVLGEAYCILFERYENFVGCSVSLSSLPLLFVQSITVINHNILELPGKLW